MTTRPRKSATAATPAAAPSEQAMGRRVLELRKKRGWSLEDLAIASGVSRSMLSEIERGRANPTLAVAFRIAQAFEMTLGELVDAQASSHRVDVIRADDRKYHYRSDRYCRIRTLSPLHMEKLVEFYEIVLRAGGALRSSPHFAGTRELLTVQSGSVTVTSGRDAQNLSRGDSAHYPADVPHAIENAGKSDAVLFLVVTYANA